jgi:hypothetical protein
MRVFSILLNGSFEGQKINKKIIEFADILADKW